MATRIPCANAPGVGFKVKGLLFKIGGTAPGICGDDDAIIGSFCNIMFKYVLVS